MFRKLFFLLILLSLNSSFAQSPGSAYFTASGNLLKYEKSDAVFCGTLIANVKAKNNFALGIGASFTKFKGASGSYNPYFGNLSYFIKDNKRGQLIAELQAGYAVYNSIFTTYDALSSFKSATTGGFYVSPGIGYYLKLSKEFSPFIKVGYVNGWFSNDATATIFPNGQQPQSGAKSETKYNSNGFILGLGLKIF